VENPTDRCKHGLTLGTCAICSGLLDDKQKKVKLFRARESTELDYRVKRKLLQEQSKVTATRYGKSFTEEELLHVLVNTEGTEETDIDIFYKIATSLKRTLASIEWLWVYAWKDERAERFIKDGSDNKTLNRLYSMKEELGI